MAVVVSRIGGAAAGPLKTGIGGLWWARCKISFTAGQTYISAGMPIQSLFQDTFGFKRIIHLGNDGAGADVTFATAEGVCSEGYLLLDRPSQRVLIFGLGRAVNGGAGVPVGALSLGNNAVNIDAMVFLCQVWGQM